MADIARQVRAALEEDIGSGDITAQLIPADAQANATVITREAAVLCGTAWVDEVFRQLGNQVAVQWHYRDGDRVAANDTLCTLSGNTRQILTGERSALNFLQTLSGTATSARRFADAVAGRDITILDTRKTLPGLRTAQKYAVLCGGGQNHRLALYDAFLIKENHIAACGSISEAIRRARALAADKRIIVEVETLAELEEAIAAAPDQIMLDEFAPEQTAAAAAAIGRGIIIELSGSFSLDKLVTLKAPAFPICLSSGSITKHVQAVDLSLRLQS
ncbi:MAG: nicotinate-nucleotide diphosphorylase (carboxylating) [Gammaproteobacteria bacterium HGW-Gammaproteobacteria-14]|nr:MAG: nicotinate-nucleotide diphosphorylase (carboxylating) [Gammaproteobacteria bacterium HGW-Gammaproteobacteria-14]